MAGLGKFAESGLYCLHMTEKTKREVHEEEVSFHKFSPVQRYM